MADQGSQGLLSPYLRSRRIEACLPHICHGRILDFGCGTGELAKFIPPERYVGVDVDLHSISIAKENFPSHTFYICTNKILSSLEGQFSTVVALAVIEHLEDALSTLESLMWTFSKTSECRLILTTPHPYSEWIHSIGARLGVFSRHANEEHEELIGKSQLFKISDTLSMSIDVYERFLFGLNQIVVMRRRFY